MRILSESVALATPLCRRDHDCSVAGWQLARAGQIPVEIRIGIGPIPGPLPARVLGYAACVASVIVHDLPKIASARPHIVLFSSAPKQGISNPSPALLALTALGSALRLAGVSVPITLELAVSAAELPEDLQVRLPPRLERRVLDMAARHGSQNSLRYAFEHAAPSMFADLIDYQPAPLRVTVGGATEACFWQVRSRVRAALIERGMLVAPAVGLIIKALRRPWYYPTSDEPALSAMTDGAAALAIMNVAVKGNAGLKREARAVERFANPGLAGLICALRTPKGAVHYASQCDLTFSRRLSNALDDHEEIWT